MDLDSRNRTYSYNATRRLATLAEVKLILHSAPAAAVAQRRVKGSYCLLLVLCSGQFMYLNKFRERNRDPRRIYEVVGSV